MSQRENKKIKQENQEREKKKKKRNELERKIKVESFELKKLTFLQYLAFCSEI